MMSSESPDAGALIAAIKAGHAAAAESLLAARPELAELARDGGVSALLLALYHGQPGIARAIRARRRSAPTIFEAAALGDAARVRELVAAHPPEARAHAPDGFTALHLAAFFGQFAAARALLDAGAPVNAEAADGSGLQPLHSAAAGRDPGAAFDLASLLLERGAAPGARQRGGYTPLHSAAASGNLSLAQLLVESGADPAARADDAKTPLDLARERGQTALVKFLEP